MPQLYIPKLGDALTLAQPWSLTVHGEYRNESLLTYMDKWDEYLQRPHRADYWTPEVPWTTPHTFPAGTVLVVDRIYIRAGGEDFNSVTFRAKGFTGTKKLWNGKTQKMKTLRFWAKLDDVNTMIIA